jgi:hypothetical protein
VLRFEVSMLEVSQVPLSRVPQCPVKPSSLSDRAPQHSQGLKPCFGLVPSRPKWKPLSLEPLACLDPELSQPQGERGLGDCASAMALGCLPLSPGDAMAAGPAESAGQQRRTRSRTRAGRSSKNAPLL